MTAAARLGREALQRLIRGASVLGTGGGGSYSLARAIVDDLDRRSLQPTLLAADALRPDMLGVSTVILGGGLSQAQIDAMPMIVDAPASLRAALMLERHLGRRFDFVFPIEIGPQNTMEAVRLAALLDVPLLDGDCAGRAVPEMHQTTLSGFGIPLAPYAVATFRDDLLLVAGVGGEERNEALCRAIAIASGGVICVSGFSVTAAALQPALIRGTPARCIDIGADIGSEPGRGDFPAGRLASKLGGRIAFEGSVARFDIDTAGGFFRGVLVLAGIDAFAGEHYRIGIQNEFMWGWRGDVLDVQCPDLLCVVDAASGLGKVTYGNGFENAIRQGERLAVLHVPADPVWTDGRIANPFPAAPSRPED